MIAVQICRKQRIYIKTLPKKTITKTSIQTSQRFQSFQETSEMYSPPKSRSNGAENPHFVDFWSGVEVQIHALWWNWNLRRAAVPIDQKACIFYWKILVSGGYDWEIWSLGGSMVGWFSLVSKKWRSHCMVVWNLNASSYLILFYMLQELLHQIRAFHFHSNYNTHDKQSFEKI